jgi:serine palmitoyltransferase
LQSRTRDDRSAKGFIKLTEKEIDELVEEWTPEPLAAEVTPYEQSLLDTTPVIVGPTGPKVKLTNGRTVMNLAAYNFAGLAGDDRIKARAIETLRNYGLGSCGPPGFYGTIDVHMQLEQDIASFLGTEDAIIYSQSFSTISCVIPAFCKRGDILVVDRGVNFAIHKGIQISRSTVRWYDHNDLKSLEEVLESVDKEMKKKKMPLTRRFIVTEGIFENDGALVDLPKIIELRQKYKYRLILDETMSFGSVGRTGRGLTELYNVPAEQIDMIVGSMAHGLCSAGGFCAGSKVMVKHQRINGTSFVFSAALPASLATSASEAIGILTSTPSLLATLHDNVYIIRSALERIEGMQITSHSASAMVHLQLRSPNAPPSGSTSLLGVPAVKPGSHKPSNPTSLLPRDPPEFDIDQEEGVLQEIVEEAQAQGVLITRAIRLRGQEHAEPRPTIKIAVTAGLSKKETEKAAAVIRAAALKVLVRRK